MSASLEISPSEVKRLADAQEDMVLVDCREPDEFAIVKIDDARLLPMSQFPACVDELADARLRRIVVYCHHGGRSLRVASWLRQNGFANAQSMSGGIDQWAVEIQPGMPRY